MEAEFFRIYSIHKHHLDLEVAYSRSTDWSVYVCKRDGDRAVVLSTQNCDRTKAFAEAYVKLAEWYSEKFGGY